MTDTRAAAGQGRPDVEEGSGAPSLEQFELEVRAFFEAHADKRSEETFVWGEGSDHVGLFPERTAAEDAADLAAARAWARRVFDAGFGWITGPIAYGGRGLARDYQRCLLYTSPSPRD